MPQGCHPADGEAGDPAHDLDLGARQDLARQRRRLPGVHPVAPGGQEQEQPACPLEQDRLHDLVDGNPRLGRRRLGGADFSRRLDRGRGDPRRLQRRRHAGQ